MRVAFLAGSLGQRGAEKQLYYMVRSLMQIGVEVQVYGLTQGDYYDAVYAEMGVPVIHIPRNMHQLKRLGFFVNELKKFRPHMVQSAQFFTNLYVGIAAKMVGAVGIGAMRSDLTYEMSSVGSWAKWLLRIPATLFANSSSAQKNAIEAGIPKANIHVLDNVIDLTAFDAKLTQPTELIDRSGIVVMAVGSMSPVKRFDRFLEAVAIARKSCPEIRAVLVGDGAEMAALKSKANTLGLPEEAVQFLGERGDVPGLLGQADILTLSSDHEGFPNVIMEAMSARLPVISTPAGDAEILVEDGTTGFVVPFEDVALMAACMVTLANDPHLRREFGEAGRGRVEEKFSSDQLAPRLIELYKSVLQDTNSRGFIPFPVVG